MPRRIASGVSAVQQGMIQLEGRGWYRGSLSHVAGRPADRSNQQGWPPLFSKECFHFPFTFPEQPSFEVLTACKEWVYYSV